MLDDILLQEDVGHAKGIGMGEKVTFPQIVAVGTVQVTDGPSWFCKDLEIARGLHPYLLPLALGPLSALKGKGISLGS